MNMKKIMLIVVIMFAAFVVLSCGGGADKSGTKTEAAQAAQETAEEIQGDASPEHEADAPSSGFSDFVPSAYRIVANVSDGDFTQNGIEDPVLLIKDERKHSVADGIVILFCFEFQGCRQALRNTELFGDVCADNTECDISIVRNNLKIIIRDLSGVTNSWTFRYNSNVDNFELIGEDYETISENASVGDIIRTSVNHLTKRRLVVIKGENDRHNETWEDINVEKLLTLSEISNISTVQSWQPKQEQITIETVTIGNQTWTKRNLNYRNMSWSYNDIDVMSYDDIVGKKGSWCHGNNPENCEMYGRLYTWAAAMETCANLGGAWRLPNDADWNTLIETTGGGYALMKPNNTGWGEYGDEGDMSADEFGFSALPGGSMKSWDGFFDDVGSSGYWWSATEVSESSANRWGMQSNSAEINAELYNKGYAFSVRCVRN